MLICNYNDFLANSRYWCRNNNSNGHVATNGCAKAKNAPFFVNRGATPALNFRPFHNKLSRQVKENTGYRGGTVNLRRGYTIDLFRQTATTNNVQLARLRLCAT